jgi:hypothetical protein
VNAILDDALTQWLRAEQGRNAGHGITNVVERDHGWGAVLLHGLFDLEALAARLTPLLATTPEIKET